MRSETKPRLRLTYETLGRELWTYTVAAALADPQTTRSPILDHRMKPLFITADNDGDGRALSLASAYLSHRAFCVPVREEIVPLDFDNREAHSVKPVIDWLNEDNYLYIEVASGGGPDRKHLYVFAPEADRQQRVRAEVSRIAPGVLRRGPMRPPGASHRSGNGPAVIVSNGHAQRLVDTLVPSPGSVRDRLSPSTVEMLDRGPVAPDRSTWDMTATWRLVLDGRSDLELIVLAADPANRYMEKAWQRTATLDYILGCVAKVRAAHRAAGHRPRSRADVDQYLEEVRDLVQRLPGDDFGGLMGRKVMTGIVQLYQAQHTLARPLAVRDVAEASSVTPGTAGKYLKKLWDLRWLTRLAPNDGPHAAEYRLETPRFDTLLHPPGGREQSVSNRIGTDLAAFRHGYLNESGRIVAQLLAQRGEMSRKELIDATGLSEGSMQKVLTRLLSVGVVTRVRRGVYRLQEDISWEVEAEGMGADRVAKAQKQRNELERQAYGRYILAQRAAITGRPYLTREWEPLNSYLAANLATGEKRPILEI